MWGQPTSPVAQGQREIDLSETLPWLEEVSRRTGKKVTVTHLFVAAVGRMLKEYPDYNVILRRNRPFKRPSVDVFVQVAVKGESGADLSGVKIVDADQGKVTTMVVSGKADAMLVDLPPAIAAVDTTGQLELLGEQYDSAPYGYVLPKDQTDFGQAIVEALKQLQADGTYEQILKKWKTEGGATTDFAVNPKVS